MEFWSWDCVVLVVIEMLMAVTGIVLNLMVVSTVRSHEKLQVPVLEFLKPWGKMWSREGDSDGRSTRRGRVKFFPIGVNSANNQKASFVTCIYKGTNLKSGTSKCSSRKQ
jgi:hypothetical protein